MAAKQEIVVYTNQGCGFCDRLVSWLQEKEIDFTEKDIKNDEQAFDEFIQYDVRGTPFTVIRRNGIDHHILGFNKKKLEGLL
ncbi:glutaredoxin family protein [Sediminibacillus terrae]|uniref:glutaredoxin family protein n=1 Tax=Sediminibacillus terrae TaxID=1562106 RepID=UPI001386A9FE|nr:glutaredoxin family protein [Sediminibacillus terrae]